jgi:hypothetical protein
MIGVGLIYRWYRRWKLAPDDAVAVHSAPAELGFLPLTDALLDLQATFAQAARRGIISPQRRHELTALARQTNFRDRSLKAFLLQAGFEKKDTDRILAETVRKKSQDAALALGTAIGLVNSHKGQSASSFSITNTFIRDLEASGIDPALLNNYN